MFCSNCGKSLQSDEEKCPHCGAVVGESRFDGDPPYTGAQQKYRPGQAVRSYGKHYSTEFVVESDRNGELPSDEDSIYRHAVSVNGIESEEEPLFNAAEEEAENEPAKKPFGLKFLHRTEEEEPEDDEIPAEDEEIGDDGLTESERRDITASDEENSIPDAGISSDVKAYMEKLRQQSEQRELKASAKSSKKSAQKKPAKKDLETELAEDEFADAVASENKKSVLSSLFGKKAAKPETDEEIAEDEIAAEEEKPLSRRERRAAKAKEAEPVIEKKTKRKVEPETIDDEETEEDVDEFGFDDDFEDESKKSRKKFGLKLGFLKKKSKDENFEDEAEPEEIDGPLPELEADEDADENEYDDVEYENDEKRAQRVRLIKNIAAVFVVLLVIGGAIFGITSVRDKSRTAPIETVTLSLWEDGVKLMETRTSDSYRKSMLGYFDRSNPGTFINMQAAFTQDLDNLSGLLPETPMQHDQVFINALKAIQESINNCLSNDALDMTDGTRTAAEKDAASALRWEAVQDIVASLKKCTNTGQLEAIIKGERVELIQKATPEPEPTPTPQPYNTLAKGASGLAVTNLQTRLSELGYLNDAIDGSFGNKTKTALEKFQQTAGLDVTGIADVSTQELLFSEGAPKAKK